MSAVGGRFKALKGSLRSKPGGPQMKRGDESTGLHRIRTGVLKFDAAMGGGLPVGRVTINAGWKGSGKTLLFLKAIGRAQKCCANCWRPARDLEVHQYPVLDDKGRHETDEFDRPIWDYEQTGTCDCYAADLWRPTRRPGESAESFDERETAAALNSYRSPVIVALDVEQTMRDAKDWLSRHLDPRLIQIIETVIAAEIGDLYLDLMSTGDVDIIMLDSIAMITPEEEVEESQGDYQRGLLARHMAKLSRRLLAAQRDVRRDYGVNITHWWVNQLSQTTGGGFGPSEVMPGGKRQEFIASIINLMVQSGATRQEFNRSGKKKDATIEVTQKRITLTTDKNKTYPDKKKAVVEMCVKDDPSTGMMSGMFYTDEYFVDVLVALDLLQKVKSKWYLDGCEFKTRRAAVAALFGESDVHDDLYEKALHALVEAGK